MTFWVVKRLLTSRRVDNDAKPLGQVDCTSKRDLARDGSNS